MVKSILVILAILLIGLGMIFQNTEIAVKTRKENKKKGIIAGAEPFERLSGSSNVVLLIHGYTGNPFEMKWLADALTAQGYDVVCPLLPGHGTTEEDLNRSRFQDWYSHIQKIYLSLRAKYKKVFVVGQSLGGTLTLKLAEEYAGTDLAPDAIGVLSAPVQFNGWIGGRLYLKDWRLSFSGIIGRIISLIKMPPDTEPYDIVPTKGYKKYFSLEALHSFVLGMNGVKAGLPKVTEPVCIIHSRLDQEIGYENAVCINGKVSSKIKKFYTVEYPEGDRTHKHTNVTHIQVRGEVFQYLIGFLKGIR